MTALTPSEVYRGNPPSPVHQPDPAQIVELLNGLFDLAATGTQLIIRDTLANLNALTGSGSTLGFVLSGGGAGTYAWNGSSWGKVAELPPGFADAAGASAAVTALQNSLGALATRSNVGASEIQNEAITYVKLHPSAVSGARADMRLGEPTGADRPGDTPQMFRVGVGNDGPPLLNDLIERDDAGPVARIVGAQVLSMRNQVPLERGRQYRLEAVVQRRVNTADPIGDGVQIGVVWFDRFDAIISQTPTVAVTIGDLTVAAGRQARQVIVGREAGPGVDLVAPVGAVYAAAVVQTFGSTATTDIEVLSLVRSDAALAAAPETADLTARIAAIESADTVARLSALEAVVTGPDQLSFATVADAAAETIGVTVDFIVCRGHLAIGDSWGARFKRVAAQSTTVLGFQSVDGQWWEAYEALSQFNFVTEADIANAASDLNALHKINGRYVVTGAGRFCISLGSGPQNAWFVIDWGNSFVPA